MDLRQHCHLMAHYHDWACARLHAQVDALDDAAYHADVQLHFGSVHGTLNHLLLVDLVWHGRLTHQHFAIDSLRDVVEPDRRRLRDRLMARGAVWVDYLAGLDDAALAGVAHFDKLDGTPATLPRASCLLHVFNHGTHHRGQISAVLTQRGLAAPEMDLPYYLYSLDAETLVPPR